ncbi:hypothetical protein [Limobrevibacterium gyesilva]|uniref:Uncharacterized protein n=1 Tax=Limobrevibacterium gyesilva TaxID=2991712 RepID=A0AA41YV71_9PROT|nr:hypothetical protein [Limobrevibacterium gyesilva]MCW3477143.1 hypothetical protein [Limobrevibacterium gyesilva]
MFATAITCLSVAFTDAIVGLSGITTPAGTAVAQHIFVIFMGMFAVAAMAVIFDVEPRALARLAKARLRRN